MVIRTDGLGDVILTVPFLRLLRQRWPQAHISLLLTPQAQPLFRACPYVDLTLSLRYPRRMQLWFRALVPVRWLVLLVLRRRVFAEQQFDLAIAPRAYADANGSAILAYLSGAPERIGVRLSGDKDRHAVNHGEDRLFSRLLQVTSDEHAIGHGQELARQLWGQTMDTQLELWPSVMDQNWAAQQLAATPASTLLLVLGVGAAMVKRRWPAERFIAVAQALARQQTVRCVVVGGSGEEALCAEVAAGIGGDTLNVCGVDLNRVAALIQRCGLYFGNDTGSMHLAAACAVPCCVLSSHPLDATAQHYNAPERYHPWNVPYVYLRAQAAAPECRDGCVHFEAPHCLLGVSVDMAVAGVLQFQQRLVDEGYSPK